MYLHSYNYIYTGSETYFNKLTFSLIDSDDIFSEGSCYYNNNSIKSCAWIMDRILTQASGAGMIS